MADADQRGGKEVGGYNRIIFKLKLKIIKQADDRVEFNISGIDINLANALRRTTITEIPVMAIEKVTFYDNSSILNDEILAHRLGLIPLKTDLKTYNLLSECNCKGDGCSRCTVTLTLDVSGPVAVYSKDLKSTDPEITPVHDSIPIVKLTEGQKVKLEAIAQLGIGSEHIKWQGGIASYEIKDNKSFDFFVESYGQLSVYELISKAFDVFGNMIDELKSELKS